MNAQMFDTPLLFGTSNRGKLSEVSFFARQLGFEVCGLAHESVSHLGPPPTVPEVSESYEGNARLKGGAYARWANRPCIADDTGLEIESLGGLPGVYTAPWGPRRVAETLGGFGEVPARFVSCMVLVEPSGRVVSVRGCVEGVLRGLSVSEASGPLPFSRFFYPEGGDTPLDVLVKEKGTHYSHRYRALQTLLRVLS
jgi:XTP/dITP diphosphohydrolase